MMRESILREIMNSDIVAIPITMEEHVSMINTQQSWLLSTVGVIRR